MNRVFLFAGGGTGGHLFPGLAIHEHLAATKGTRSVFLCSDRPLDADILKAEGVPFEPIRARPMSLRPTRLARFLASWGPSVRSVRAIIQRERARGAEVHLVAMGGFVAAPCVQAARAERCPVTLVNLDAVPGKANRWIARHAARVVTSASMPGTTWPIVPPIVRAAAHTPLSREECRTRLGLDAATPALLVTGASQGARSINRLLLALLLSERRAFDGWQVIHQTGKGEDEAARARYQAARVPALVRPFFDTMGLAWGAADLAVSRAGAGSVAEAWANRTPTVFMPYPYHRDQHQRLNAEPLEQAGGAALVEDKIDERANLREAGRVIVELMADARARQEMRTALARLGPADGAARVARLLLG